MGDLRGTVRRLGLRTVPLGGATRVRSDVAGSWGAGGRPGFLGGEQADPVARSTGRPGRDHPRSSTAAAQNIECPALTLIYLPGVEKPV